METPKPNTTAANKPELPADACYAVIAYRWGWKNHDGGFVPPIPAYLQAAPLASAIARGLSHEQHKAEFAAGGQCVQCGKPRDMDMGTVCQSCADKLTAKYSKR